MSVRSFFFLLFHPDSSEPETPEEVSARIAFEEAKKNLKEAHVYAHSKAAKAFDDMDALRMKLDSVDRMLEDI